MTSRSDFSEAAVVRLLQQLASCPDHSLLEDKALRITALQDHLEQWNNLKDFDVERLAVLLATALEQGLQLICRQHPSRRASMSLGIINEMLNSTIKALKRGVYEKLPMAQREHKRQLLAVALAEAGEAVALTLMIRLWYLQCSQLISG
jgi:hypothetical protein